MNNTSILPRYPIYDQVRPSRPSHSLDALGSGGSDRFSCSMAPATLIAILFQDNWLVVEPTPLKNDGVKVSWDDDIPNIIMESHKIHVPNRQPVMFHSKPLTFTKVDPSVLLFPSWQGGWPLEGQPLGCSPGAGAIQRMLRLGIPSECQI